MLSLVPANYSKFPDKHKPPRQESEQYMDDDEEGDGEDDTDDPIKAKTIRKKLSMSDKRGK